MKKTILTAAAIAAMLGATVTGAAADDKKPEMEKCYGVVKAGKNHCASASGNSCAGTSKTDGDAHAWVLVPKGLCESLVNGSLSEPE